VSEQPYFKEYRDAFDPWFLEEEEGLEPFPKLRDWPPVAFSAGTDLRHCKGCGEMTLETWYEAAFTDDGDVEPRAQCIDNNCMWGY
jgi:hypothetical protein